MDRYLYLAALLSLASASFACAGGTSAPTERTIASPPGSTGISGDAVAGGDPAVSGTGSDIATGNGSTVSKGASGAADADTSSGATSGASSGSTGASDSTAGGSTGSTDGSTGTTGGSTGTAGGSTGGTGGSTGSTGGSTGGTTAAGSFRGDGSQMPSFGGWAWGNVPSDAAARAGFDWFETGYPGDAACNQPLLDAKVRPFAYINLGELDPTLQTGYTGAILRTNSDWGTSLVDVTDSSWQSWIVRRAHEAYTTGSRGVKWDVATPDIPPGKSRDDVNAAIAKMMQAVLDQHPDMKFIFNQGFEFATAYPQYVHGIETEGLFSASSYAAAYLQPWKDPWYWGPQYQQAKAMHVQYGTPIIVAEYADPSSDGARALYAAITAEGFVPYITSDHWNIRGWGYNVAPGW